MHNILNITQPIFRKNHSRETQLNKIIHRTWLSTITRKKKTSW